MINATATAKVYTSSLLPGTFSDIRPARKPIAPTMTNVNGAHAAQPENRSKKAIPKAPAIAPVFLPYTKAAIKRGTLPKWTRPPLPIIGSLMLMNIVATRVNAMNSALMTKAFVLVVSIGEYVEFI